MSLSGTTSYAFQRDDILRRAHEACGVLDPGQPLTAEMTKTAVDLLYAMGAEWQAKHIRLWKREPASFTVTNTVASYDLADDTIDIEVDTVFVRRSNADDMVTRITEREFAERPDKASREGKADEFLLRRNRTITSGNTDWSGGLTMVLYPTPDNSTDEIHYTRIKRLDDFGLPNTNPDAPWKWTMPLIYGLAYELGFTYGLSPARHDRIKRRFEDAFDTARRDDNERGNVMLGVDVGRYYTI